MLHLHIVLGDEKFQAYGGHLKNAVVSATCEIAIFELDSKIKRKYDDEIGLNLLDI